MSGLFEDETDHDPLATPLRRLLLERPNQLSGQRSPVQLAKLSTRDRLEPEQL